MTEPDTATPRPLSTLLAGVAQRRDVDWLSFYHHWHGLDLPWPCTGCGRELIAPDLPTSQCPGCKRPFATLCERCKRHHIEPVYDGTWCDGPVPCEPCRAEQLTRHWEYLLSATFAASDLAKARDYKRWPNRTVLDIDLRAWLNSDCGRDVHRSVLYVEGEHGSGKTIALVRAAIHALEHGAVKDVYYITEGEFRRHASAAGGRDEEAMAVVNRCASAELLVLDELGLAPMNDEPPPRGMLHHRVKPLTAHQAQELSLLLYSRMQRGLPTLLATNRTGHALGPLGWIGPELASRFAEYGYPAGQAIVCTGIDHRREG